MPARPRPAIRALLLGLGLWILAGLLALFDAASNGPFGSGFSLLALAARIVGLAAAVFSLWAIWREAAAQDFLGDAAEPTGAMAAVSPSPPR
ncbi:hypothetical protein ACX8Z9_13370 [Arthrobacter halodurans]|uniref:Uncharacterized protein n=1 Tax=Arthrobacter halodurans TaxID=516699 RepID=A0ABV4UQV4_9MICC